MILPSLASMITHVDIIVCQVRALSRVAVAFVFPSDQSTGTDNVLCAVSSLPYLYRYNNTFTHT